MKTLILTEKPSVAMDFCKALGVGTRKDGYAENEKYIITWAVGHLVTLKEPQEYDPKWKKWDINLMPIIPQNISYKPIDQSKKQLKIIESLFKNEIFKEIVVATDAGREGEVIARTILNYIGLKKECPIYRFWTSQALTPPVIRSNLSSIRPLSEYDALWDAGQARQEADWLVGMNLSRAVTLSFKSKDIFSVGRVQTAVLSLLVDRKKQRESFIPTPYWIIQANFTNNKGMWPGTWFDNDGQRILDEKKAENILQKITGKQGCITKVLQQEKKKAPPQLYSLTDLQQEANTFYGYSAQKTLDLCQSLYEADKCLSYPRTSSRVLGSQNIDMVNSIITELKNSYPSLCAGIQSDLIKLSNTKVFNDKKLSDHHALIPLSPCSENITDDKKRIYDMVLTRFISAFYPDCKYKQTEIITEIEEETFKTTGKFILQAGWTALYPTKTKDLQQTEDEQIEHEDLPDLNEKDPARAEKTEILDKITSPPPEYTEASLLKDMTNPGKYVTEEQLKKIFRGDIGLGTQATRAQIIETLLKRSYIERKGKTILATEKGCFLIHNIRKLGAAGTVASPDATAAWEMRLEDIATSNSSAKKFMAEIHDFIKKSINQIQSGSNFTYMAPEKTNLGKCPICEGNIIEGKKGYGCSNYKQGCQFVIWKTIAQKTLTSKMVSDLLTKKKTSTLKGFMSKKTGKKFDAALELVFSKEKQNYEVAFVFNNKK